MDMISEYGLRCFDSRFTSGTLAKSRSLASRRKCLQALEDRCHGDQSRGNRGLRVLDGGVPR